MSEPIQDDIAPWMTKVERLEAELDEAVADLNAARFSEREWRDKAQDKIAECEELVAERDRLVQALEEFAWCPDPDISRMARAALDEHGVL